MPSNRLDTKGNPSSATATGTSYKNDVLILPMIGWFLEEVGTDLLVFGDVFRHVFGVSRHLLQKLPQLTAKETCFFF